VKGAGLEVMTDDGAAHHRERGERHGQGARVDATAVLDEPEARQAVRERGLQLAHARVRRQRLHGDSLSGQERRVCLGLVEIGVLQGHLHHAGRLAVHEYVERRLVHRLAIRVDARAVHRDQRLVVGHHQQTEVPARRAGGQVLAFDQRDRRAAGGELERTGRTDDPAPHHDHVRHVGSLAGRHARGGRFSGMTTGRYSPFGGSSEPPHLTDTSRAGNSPGTEVRVRTRLIGLLAAGVLFLGVATNFAPNASAASGASCSLVRYKVVGLRSYNYAVTVRMSNLTPSWSRVTTTLADRDNKSYRIGATLAGNTTVTTTRTFSAPPGTTFRVVGCSQR
jgi:hypothetical protein